MGFLNLIPLISRSKGNFRSQRNLLCEFTSKIKKLVGNEEIESSLKRVGLERAMELKVKKYSLGMKQRLNIAQAVFEGPVNIRCRERRKRTGSNHYHCDTP